MTTQCTLCGADGHAAKDCPWRGAVPDGYKLVPVEPSEDMFIAGMEADCLGRPSVDDETHVRSIWNAMLAAATSPAAEGELASDRKMLYTALADLDNSYWNCPRCGHAEPAKDMDVAYMIRRHLDKPAAEGAKVGECTCPSGDGSLRWPCPQHPAKES